MGIKAPRGLGFITNPKKAFYNKIYNKTSFGVDSLTKQGGQMRPAVSGKTLGKTTSLLLSISLAILLLVIYWPLGIAYIGYKTIRSFLNKKKRVDAAEPTDDTAKSVGLAVTKTDNNTLINSWNIPEPTRSLLFATDEDVSKIQNPMSIAITVSLDVENQRVNTSADDHKTSQYAEPSLIWTRLPIKENDDLVKEPMYYPAYSRLSPEERYQYLNWLKDVTKETNLSYVFLYFYGLERHLLLGNYDLAVDEILRLLKYHDKGTFRSYATGSLVAASVFRKRADILERAPFILDQPSNISLCLRMMVQKEFTAKNIIDLASYVGFSNKRYIKLKPDAFEKELQQLIDEYHVQNGFILSQIGEVASDEERYFANTSVPDRVRTIKTPQIMKSAEFKQIILDLLTRTHSCVKEMVSMKQD